MKIKKYNDLIKMIKENNELIIDLTDLNNHDYMKAIYFMSGLTYLHGEMIKLQCKTFKIKY